MKNFLYVLTTFCVLCTGCAAKTDTTPAVLEVTSNGKSSVHYTVHQNNSNVDIVKRAIYNPVKVTEGSKLHFYCTSCEKDEEYTVTGNFSKLFFCDCPEYSPEVSREYIAVVSN